MALRVSGKNIEIGEALRQQITDRVLGVVGKFYSGAVTGHVTVLREGSGIETDCVLHLSSGVTLHAEGFSHDAYASAEKAAEKVEQRLRRYKHRLKDHGPGGASKSIEVPYSVIQAPDDDDTEMVVDEFNPIVIAETKKDMRRLSVKDAVMEIDMTGAPVLLFQHAGSGRVNFVYRRSDGNIGWVDPPALEP